jgi:hypothetical protein
VVGTSINFGLAGPIAESGWLVENDLIGIEETEHRHRLNGPRHLVVRDGPRIIAVVHRVIAPR